MPMSRVLLVIPAYNEAPVIVPTVRALARALSETDLDWSIVVADNASSDHTGDVVRDLNDPRVLVHPVPSKGKGNAVIAAFDAFPADIYAFTDADLAIDPEQVIGSILRIARAEADIAYGSRLSRASDLGRREWWRTLSSRSFNLLARMITGVTASDTQCPLKAMTHGAARLLIGSSERGWFFDLEFLARAEKQGFRIVEIPVRWTEHRYPGRKTKLKLLDSVRAIQSMFAIRHRLALRGQDSALATHDILATMHWTIVGLGNPGPSHAGDRHNVGRMALRRLATAHFGSEEFREKKKHEALVQDGVIADVPVRLVMPETYMNESGRSVSKFISSPNDAARLVVIHDDIDLPLGTWKFAYDRGEGGHNGLRSISSALQTRAYIRIRIGVLPVDPNGESKKPKGEDAVVKFVLGSFAPKERDVLDGVLQEVADGIEALIRDGLDTAMLRFHTEQRQQQ